MGERKQFLLEGQIVDPKDAELLAEQLDRLEKKIHEKKDDLRQIELANATASMKLRALHIALCAFFDDSSTSGMESASSPSNGKWEAIKQRNPGKKSEIVDLLMIQRKMTITQISTALKGNYYTIRNVLREMQKQGLLENDGDGYSLKEI